MAIKEETGGTSKKPVKKPTVSKPAAKTPSNGGVKGNVGHIREVAVKSAVESFMRYYGDSGIEARDRVRGILGKDFKSLSAKSQRDWPDIIQKETASSSGGGWSDGYYGGSGGGGGGGSSLPLPPPPFKIRTTSGQRLTPYWESSPDFIQGWVPRLTVLGQSQAW